MRLLRLPLETLLTCAALIACTVDASKTGEMGSATSSGNHEPVVRSVRIVPTPVVLNRPVSIEVEGFDSDGDIVTYRHQWRINDAPERYPALDVKNLKRGDRIAVAVIPYDGTVEGAAFQTATIVSNTPPDVATLAFDPAEVHVGDRIHPQIESLDADGDSVEYRYRWWRNNSEVADGYMDELDTAGFAKGDTIVVEVTPFDPTGKGKSKISSPITILNSAPSITSVPPAKLDRSRFIYPVTAQDPDGDALTYALESGPPGMKIDKMSGQIEWLVTVKTSGRYKVRVTATDTEEASAFQEFELTLSPPASSSRLAFSKNFRLNTRLVSPFPALLE